MMDYTLEIREPRPSGRHRFAATLAAVISVGLHLAALIHFADVRFGITIASPDAIRARRAKSIRLGEVHRKLAVRDGKVLRLRDGAPIRPVDAAAEAEMLGLIPDAVGTAPPALAEGRMAGEDRTLAGPSAVPTRQGWQRRRDILIVESRVAEDRIRGQDRWEIPSLERVKKAPDIVVPVDVAMVRAGDAGMATESMLDPTVMSRAPTRPVEVTRSAVVMGDTNTVAEVRLFREARKDVTEYTPIEDVLTARVSTYVPFGDFQYGYFRIEVDRVGEEVLPVIPKDVIFVQDCSASMAEQRLYFCRQGLTNGLTLLGKDDRFNVVSFRDTATFCFKDWAGRDARNLETARRFILNMTSAGNTDIFFSIKDLSTLKRTPGRPVVVLLVTDGRSTTGLTKSSDIIGEFSKLNDGGVSVFTLGTMQLANTYLLDLLSYCNRGDTSIVTGGRWGIADTMTGLLRETSRPVLSDMTCRFAEGSGCEVYPVFTSNLYLDRTVVLYGRYPRGLDGMVFQVKGKAERNKCDMVFDLGLGKETRSRDKTIREEWAEQKIYHLMGEHARRPSPDILKELDETSKTYRVKIPYRESL